MDRCKEPFLTFRSPILIIFTTRCNINVGLVGRSFELFLGKAEIERRNNVKNNDQEDFKKALIL